MVLVWRWKYCVFQRSVEKLKTVQEKQGEGESVSIREECEEWRERAERAEAELEKLRSVLAENEVEMGEAREAALRKSKGAQDEQDLHQIGREILPEGEKEGIVIVRKDAGEDGGRIGELEEENRRLAMVIAELREKMSEMAARLEEGESVGEVLEEVGLRNFVARRSWPRRRTREVFIRLYEDALKRVVRLRELRARVRTLREREFLAVYYARAGYEAFTGFEVGWSGKLRIGGRRDGDEETRRGSVGGGPVLNLSRGNLRYSEVVFFSESRLKSLDETTRRRQMVRVLL